jgi:hypothetical protein
MSYKKQSKDLKKFLDGFLITIFKCVPHHLHEEVFSVCELILDLSKDWLRQDHLKAVVDALTDKYTMRSKAHKKL